MHVSRATLNEEREYFAFFFLGTCISSHREMWYKVLFRLFGLQQFGRRYGPNHVVPESSIGGHHWDPFQPISIVPNFEELYAPQFRNQHANGWEHFHYYDELKKKGQHY